MQAISKTFDSNFRPRKDYSNKQVNAWYVIRPLGCIRSRYAYNGKETTISVPVYECRCECGTVQSVRLDDLRSNKSKRCYSCAQAKVDFQERNRKAVRTRAAKAKDAGKKGYWKDLLPDIPPEYGIKLFTSSISRGIEFSLTAQDLNEAWLRQRGKCVYTGISLVFKHHDEMFAASVDRIDSTRGYVMGNIQIVSRKINKMKWDLSHDDFIVLMKSVLEYQNGKLTN